MYCTHRKYSRLMYTVYILFHFDSMSQIIIGLPQLSGNCQSGIERLFLCVWHAWFCSVPLDVSMMPCASCVSIYIHTFQLASPVLRLAKFWPCSTRMKGRACRKVAELALQFSVIAGNSNACNFTACCLLAGWNIFIIFILLLPAKWIQ